MTIDPCGSVSDFRPIVRSLLPIIIIIIITFEAESRPEECKNLYIGALILARRLGNSARANVNVIMRQPADLTYPTPVRTTSYYYIYIKITKENRCNVSCSGLLGVFAPQDSRRTASVRREDSKRWQRGSHLPLLPVRFQQTRGWIDRDFRGESES